MLLLQSVLVYSFFALSLYFLSKTERVAIKLSRDNNTLPISYWACIIVFCIISGLRWDVGVDHLSYLDNYLNMQQGTYISRSRGIEPAYYYITRICADLGLHFSVYFSVLAFFQIYFIIQAFKYDKEIIPYILIVIVLGGYYFDWMNGIRQMIVACSFIWATKFIAQKKLLPYCVWIICAYTMHHSVLLLLPVFLITFDKTEWNNSFWLIIIVLVCIIIGNTPMFVSQLKNLGNLLSFIGYEHYSDRLDSIIDIENFNSKNFGPRMMVNLVIYLFCIWFSKDIQSKRYRLYFKLFYIGICTYYLFVNTQNILLRPISYFTIFAIPVTAYTLLHLKKQKKYFLFSVLLCISLSYCYLACIADYNKDINLRKSHLYQFYFNNYPTLNY